MTPSPADAEDLAQDVLLRSYQAIDRFDGPYPKAWLYRIARNSAISRTRRRDRLEFVADPAESILGRLPTGGRQPDAEVLDQRLDALLEQALDSLSPRHRSVVDLVDIHGLSYDEAATALGIPVGTVMSRLHRARHRLRDALAGTHLARPQADAPPVLA